MKKNLLILAFVLSGVVCSIAKPIIIQGHAAPRFRKPLRFYGYKCLADYVLYDQKKMLIAELRPDSSGDFRLSYEMKGERSFFLTGDGISLFYEAMFNPGDSIFIEINDTNMQGRPFQFPMVHIHGSGAWSMSFNDKHQNSGFLGYMHQFGLSKDSFVRYIDSVDMAEKMFVDHYTKQNKLPEVFINNFIEKQKYDWINEKLVYIWMHDQVTYKPEKVDDSYFSFIRKADVNNEQALYCGTYYRFMNEYPQELVHEKAAHQPDGKKEGRLNVWGIAGYRMEAHIIDSLFTGHIHEIADGVLISNKLRMLNDTDMVFRAQQLSWIDSILEKIKPVSIANNDSVYERLAAKRQSFEALKNSQAALFAFPDSSKKVFSLADYRGKVVLLDFWEIGCVPCVKAIPAINKLQADLEGKKFAEIGICSPLPESAWKWWLKSHPYTGIQILASPESQILSKYNIEGFPHYILIDKKGIIRDANANVMDKAALEKEIGVLMGE